ncbi:MAG: mechanosensitive ion channel [Myxococcota bacterium]
MEDSVITEALARWTDWPLLSLLVRALLIGLVLLVVDRVVSRVVMRAWRRGHDKARTLAWARPMTRLVLGVAGLFGVFAPLHATNPVSALLLGLLLVGVATLWGLEPLKNVAGGLALSLSHAFEMGSEIRVGEVCGVVEQIELTRISIRTREGSILHIPTRYFVTDTVHGPTDSSPALPVSVDVPLCPSLSLEQAVSALRDEAYLSTYTYSASAVLIEVLGGGRARLMATPVTPSDAVSLRSDLAARAQALCRESSTR